MMGDEVTALKLENARLSWHLGVIWRKRYLLIMCQGMDSNHRPFKSKVINFGITWNTMFYRCIPFWNRKYVLLYVQP